MPSAITIKQVPGQPGQVYYPLEKITIPDPKPSENQVSLIIPFVAYKAHLSRLLSPYQQLPLTTAIFSSANTSTLAQHSEYLSSQTEQVL